MTVPIKHPPPRPCKRCRILARHLDRCGHCLICQEEFATGHYYIRQESLQRLARLLAA